MAHYLSWKTTPPSQSWPLLKALRYIHVKVRPMRQCDRAYRQAATPQGKTEACRILLGEYSPR